jgi:hypothetical protein
MRYEDYRCNNTGALFKNKNSRSNNPTNSVLYLYLLSIWSESLQVTVYPNSPTVVLLSSLHNRLLSNPYNYLIPRHINHSKWESVVKKPNNLTIQLYVTREYNE